MRMLRDFVCAALSQRQSNARNRRSDAALIEPLKRKTNPHRAAGRLGGGRLRGMRRARENGH